MAAREADRLTATPPTPGEHTAPSGSPPTGVDPLGPAYVPRRLDLPGGAVATLVRHAAGAPTRSAVLYVHGFVDYFFQTHLAEHFAARGHDFYALDLRGYGRSIQPGELPYFVTDLRVYDDDLDAAWRAVVGDGHDRIVVMGHSTGGLIVSLWLADRIGTHSPTALVLNSPWLDLAEPWLMRTVGTQALHAIGAVAPRFVVPQGLSPAYGMSIHADHHGEWTFDVAWKPLSGTPVHAGWISAVRRGHARVHAGLDLPMPVLVMHSNRSLKMRAWAQDAMSADTVLDVRQMSRWAPKLGPRVTDLTVPGALHDIFLSAPDVRAAAFAGLDAWLDTHAGW